MTNFEKLLTAYRWLRLFFTTLAASTLLALLLWHSRPGFWGELAGWLLITFGTIIGLYLAEKQRKMDVADFEGNPGDSDRYEDSPF